MTSEPWGATRHMAMPGTEAVLASSPAVAVAASHADGYSGENGSQSWQSYVLLLVSATVSISAIILTIQWLRQ